MKRENSRRIRRTQLDQTVKRDDARMDQSIAVQREALAAALQLLEEVRRIDAKVPDLSILGRLTDSRPVSRCPVGSAP